MENIEFPNISKETNCFLIKTNNGKYYEEYLQNHYITLYHFNIDSKTQSIISVIGNKKDYELSTFTDLVKVDDYVIIPNRNNKELSIGIITSSCFYYEDRVYRNVSWIKTIKTSELNQIYQYLHVDHSIIQVNNLKPQILQMIYPFYEEEGVFHLILQVKQKSGILFKSLYGFSDLLLTEVGDENLLIKVTLQSPGIIELISENIDVIITVIKVIKLIYDLTKGKDKYNEIEQKLLKKYYEYQVDKLQILPLKIDKNDDIDS